MTSSILPRRTGGALALVLTVVLGAALPAAAQTAAPPGGVPVQAAAVIRQDLPVELRNIGTVQAFDSVLVRARVDGTLDRVFFTEGQDVKTGQLLAQIDPRPYAAALAAAEAKQASDEALLANAQRDYARYSSLARNDFASRQQVDTQRSLVQELQAATQGDAAQIATAQLNLDYAHITSPIDGRTGIRLVDPGNLLQAAQATGIVTVTQIHPISVVFTLPQDDLPQIQAGMARGTLPVTAFTGDDRTELGSGTLLTIDNAIDQSTGTIKLKATFPNPDDKLWPGQFVNVRLRVGTQKDVLTIPSAAVQNGPAGQYVYQVKSDDTVAQVPIESGLVAEGSTVVTKGLSAGDRVVTYGQERLQAGVKVDVTKSGVSG